ncbi:MAG: ABC transporter substrate-binding protein [Stellaceae bacterium]
MIGKFVGAALAAAMLVSAGPGAAQQTARTKVVLGVSGRPDQADLELALKRGYFEQQGLDIETVQARSGQEMIPSLASNQLQVASGSPNAGLFNALNRGIDIRLVADFAHVGPKGDRTVAVVAREDLMNEGVIKSPADLKGRSVARGPGSGQITDLLFSTLFRTYGFTMADVTMRSLTFADSLAALTSKTLDSAFLVEPLVTMAERRHIARVLVDGGSVIPGSELSVVYYSPEFARNKDAAGKFMVAYLQGVRDYYDAFFLGKNKDATIKVLTSSLPVRDPTIWESSRQYTDLNGRINVADVKRQAAFYKSEGLISGPVPDIGKDIDPSFAEAAVKILGERKR